jgi:hypothetical protein
MTDGSGRSSEAQWWTGLGRGEHGQRTVRTARVRASRQGLGMAWLGGLGVVADGPGGGSNGPGGGSNGPGGLLCGRGRE